MGLEIKVKRAILRELASRYRSSSKTGKGEVVGKLVGITG